MARVPVDPSRLARVDSAVREMFENFCGQPIPGRLLSVIDQMDDSASQAEPKPRRRKRKQA